MVSRYLLPQWLNERLSLHWKTADINWARTRAFLIDNANEGYIRVNLKGREPEGVVEDQPEYEALCEMLVNTATTMINPENGKLAAREVHRADDLYSGPCRQQMPDVIINWDPEACVSTELGTEQYGRVEVEQPAYAVSPYYTGNHRPNAFMAVLGPGVAKGLVLRDTSILDFAPTILRHFGVELPPHLNRAGLSISERDS